jgi:hypothetical protein
MILYYHNICVNLLAIYFACLKFYINDILSYTAFWNLILYFMLNIVYGLIYSDIALFYKFSTVPCLLL